MYQAIIIFLLICTSALAKNIEPERTFEFSEKIVLEIDEGNLTFEGKFDGRDIKILARPRNTKCQDDLRFHDQKLRLTNKKTQGGCPCDYIIYAPQETLIDVTSGASSIIVNDMIGALNVKSGAGSIEGNSFLEQANIQLGAGNVSLNVNSSSSLKIGAGKGKLSFSKIPQDKVNLEIAIGTGEAELSLPANAKVHYETHSIKKDHIFPDNPDDYKFKINLSTGFGKINMSKIQH